MFPIYTIKSYDINVGVCNLVSSLFYIIVELLFAPIMRNSLAFASSSPALQPVSVNASLKTYRRRSFMASLNVNT